MLITFLKNIFLLFGSNRLHMFLYVTGLKKLMGAWLITLFFLFFEPDLKLDFWFLYVLDLFTRYSPPSLGDNSSLKSHLENARTNANQLSWQDLRARLTLRDFVYYVPENYETC